MVNNMQVTSNNPNLIFLLLSFLICFILYQIYLVFKIKVIVQRILEIFIKIDRMTREFQRQQSGKKTGSINRCENCKNRMVYFHTGDEAYFYIKCRLNNQVVNSEDFCHHFVLDPQNLKI